MALKFASDDPGNKGTVTSVTAADTSIVVGGTAADPTVRTNTLDVIAADHPPAADWSNASHKITNIANGSSAQDAAAFGQIPTSLPPSGAAGGDLASTFPNPQVAAIHETSGPTKLTIGAIADGQYAKRSGSALVSGAPVDSVTASDASITVAGTATAPTIAARLKAFVNLATTAALPANTYANGSSGVGATLTANANGSLTVDSSVVAVGIRIVVKDEATQPHNGVYVVTAAGDASTKWVLTRATDYDTAAKITEGDAFPVFGGIVNSGVLVGQIAPAPLVVGTDAIAFSVLAPVRSVFGRTGTVLATPGDYTAAQVTSAADKSSTSSQSFAAGVVSTHATQGVGYATGAGGTVTQNTNKSTGVTLNKITGQITMNNAALAAGAAVAFTMSNNTLAAGDVVVANITGGFATSGTYTLDVLNQSSGGGGAVRMRLTNISAGSLSEAIVINFVVIKGTSS